MIPVNPLAILIGTLIMLLSVISLIALLTLAVLWCWPRTRPMLRRRPRLLAVLMILLGVLSAPGIWAQLEMLAFAAEQRAAARALNPTLLEPLRLEDIEFPAGSRVRLERAEAQTHWRTGDALPYGLETLQEAWFAEPVEVRGLWVERLYSPSGYYFAQLDLAGDQPVEGWPCADSAPVEFQRDAAARLRPATWLLRQCALQTGSRVAGVEWPAGSTLVRSGSEWRLRSSGTASMSVGDMQLSWLELRLSAERATVAHAGALAEPLQLGSMHYAAGTEVMIWPDGQRWFSPRRVPARDSDGDRLITPGNSVLQSADGQVLGVRENAQLGIIDWAEFDLD